MIPATTQSEPAANSAVRRAETGTAANHDAERTEFLKSLRRRADVAVLGSALSYRRRSNRPGLRQEEVAEALRARGLRVTVGWFQKLEAGTARWSEPLVAAYADLLQLATAERAILYKVTLGYEPVSIDPPDGVSEANRAHIDALSGAAAYIEDDAWCVRYCNATMRAWFPWLSPGVNVMVWALTDPVARRVLVQWRDKWAAPMLAQLRTAWWLADGELKERLYQVIDTCRLASPDVEQLWREESYTYYFSPMGEVRPVDLPATGPIDVLLWAAEPVARKGWRAISMHRTAALPTGAQAAPA